MHSCEFIYFFSFLKTVHINFKSQQSLIPFFPTKPLPANHVRPGQTSGTVSHGSFWALPLGIAQVCGELHTATHARQLQPCQPSATRTLMGFNVCNDPRHRCWVSNSQSHITFAHLQMIMPSLLQAYQIRNKTAFLCRQYITNTSVKLFPAEPYVYPFAHL